MDYIVNTPCGPVQGTAGRVPGTAAYMGIRYATAGRWEYPTPVTSWEGTYDATSYGACSYQPRSFSNSRRMAAFSFSLVESGNSLTSNLAYCVSHFQYSSQRSRKARSFILPTTSTLISIILHLNLVNDAAAQQQIAIAPEFEIR